MYWVVVVNPDDAAAAGGVVVVVAVGAVLASAVDALVAGLDVVLLALLALTGAGCVCVTTMSDFQQ